MTSESPPTVGSEAFVASGDGADPGTVALGAATCGELARRVNDDRVVLMRLFIEAHAKLTRTLGDELEEAVGLPLTWFVVLLHLGRSEKGRLTMSQLGAEISLTSGGITRLVDRMAAGTLVERQHCPSDRRSIYVALTPEGEATLERAMAEHLRSLDRHLVEPLTPVERKGLEAALRKLRGPGPVDGG